MKNLILISGAMGVGKSAVCRELKPLLAPCLFLDGDWCWDMEPFLVNEQTKALALDNIASQLNRALACPAFRNVLFCWVMPDESVAAEILSRLRGDYRLFRFALTAGESTLITRLQRDIDAGLRSPDVIGRSLDRRRRIAATCALPVDTEDKRPAEVAREIACLVKKEV